MGGRRGRIWWSHTFLTGPQSKHTKWNTETSTSTEGEIFPLWGQSNTGTGCPARMWSLHPWRYLNTSRTQPGTTCSCCFCFELGGWTRWSPGVPSILLFCDFFNHSVILWFSDYLVLGAVSMLSYSTCSDCFSLSLEYLNFSSRLLSYFIWYCLYFLFVWG